MTAEKRVAIHQPNYLPWIGYFHKIALVDEFVFFDDVQLPQGKSFCSRVKVLGPNGPHWLTVPVNKGSDVLIKDARIPDMNWRRKHLKALEINYGRTPHFELWWSTVKNVIETSGDSLAELNQQLIEGLCAVIGLHTRFIRASHLDLGGASSEDHILKILETVDATVYVSGEGAGSRRYVEEERFANRGIRLEWQGFEHPVYNQGEANFHEFMTVVDLLSYDGPLFLQRTATQKRQESK